MQVSMTEPTKVNLFRLEMLNKMGGLCRISCDKIEYSLIRIS